MYFAGRRRKVDRIEGNDAAEGLGETGNLDGALGLARRARAAARPSLGVLKSHGMLLLRVALAYSVTHIEFEVQCMSLRSSPS